MSGAASRALRRYQRRRVFGGMPIALHNAVAVASPELRRMSRAAVRSGPDFFGISQWIRALQNPMPTNTVNTRMMMMAIDNKPSLIASITVYGSSSGRFVINSHACGVTQSRRPWLQSPMHFMRSPGESAKNTFAFDVFQSVVANIGRVLAGFVNGSTQHVDLRACSHTWIVSASNLFQTFEALCCLWVRKE